MRNKIRRFIDVWIPVILMVLIIIGFIVLIAAKISIYYDQVDGLANCAAITQEYKACNEWGESKVRQMCEAAATTKAMGCYGVTSDSL